METSLDNKSKFSECMMYDLHYDMINVDRLDMGRLKSDAYVPCKNGWTYKVDDIKNSVVSEVRILHFEAWGGNVY